MHPNDRQVHEAHKALARLLPRIEGVLQPSISSDPEGWRVFQARMDKHFPDLFGLYLTVYQDRYDFFYHLEDLITSLARAWFERSPALRALDAGREADPLWFQSNQMLGGVCYVDLFAGTLEGVRSKIPYFKELGLTYLHLMPLFKVPEGGNDGGYAVSSYREVNPSLGSMPQLTSLAQELREAGISLAVDLVFNHTSDEHPWAMAAKAGVEEYQEFYYIFPDRLMPDQYERNLREIFPDEHPGAFTFFPDIRMSRQGSTDAKLALQTSPFPKSPWGEPTSSPELVEGPHDGEHFLSKENRYMAGRASATTVPDGWSNGNSIQTSHATHPTQEPSPSHETTPSFQPSPFPEPVEGPHDGERFLSEENLNVKGRASTSSPQGDLANGSRAGAPSLSRGGWVWTTFHSYQWDLNYANPAVFNRMAEEMLFLANQGVEVLRLDAVAFIWKQMGTACENLPLAHTLIRAFNAVARIAAPALIFKSEAIVHPDEVVKYISPGECQISYNPLLMALLWNSLATRQVQLLSQALATRFKLHAETTWVNYVRVHDDIGWTFSDQDAAMLGINGFDHRRFLNDFYRGTFPGSFARGLPFQENPQTGDCRISGTCASLAGLEKALLEEGPKQVELAIWRIHLLYGVVLLAGGIPLIYLGDEIGTLNDYGYSDNPVTMDDSRWVHRIRMDWGKVARRENARTVEGKVYLGLHELIKLRKSMAVFSGGELEVFWTENEHVLGFMRYHEGKRCVILANFSEAEQIIPTQVIKQIALENKQQLHGRSKLTFSGDETVAPLDLLVFG